MKSEHIAMTGQELVQRMESDRFGELHIKLDEDTRMRAIIAVHSPRLGPALGGARCIPYSCFDAAVDDAARLAKGMSYKAAVAGLPQGGGKAVLRRPETIADLIIFERSAAENRTTAAVADDMAESILYDEPEAPNSAIT